MKVIATKCIARDLKPGDLFSTAGPEYWESPSAEEGIGQRVYVRTNNPAKNAHDPDLALFRLEIVTEVDETLARLDAVFADLQAQWRASSKGEGQIG